MKNYQTTTFQTEAGTFDFIELGNHVYGEWIIYEKDIPKFHINVFGRNTDSDRLIKQLMETENESIEEIIKTINLNLNLSLSFGKRPKKEWIVETKLKAFELKPLPMQWFSTSKNKDSKF
jgi:hypothetical protein